LQNWTDKINGSPRSKIIEEKHRDEMSKAVGYKPLVYDKAALWVLSDSVLVSTQYINLYKSNRKKYLFQFSDKQVSTEDWLKFVKNKQSLAGGGSLNGWEELMKEFTENTIEQHYKDRLEKMNPEFRWQMQEFTEGSLLFEVMEKSIWSKAPTDTSGLMSYYEQNRSKYVWEKSADAIIFNCADTSVAFKVKQQVEKDFSKWKTYMEQQGGYALADSGRFELTQLPATEALQNLQPAMTTSVQSNSGDGSASFCYIIRLYPDKEPRQFEAAKGLVINDYQQVLEEKWISSLKKKYPVVIQEDNLKKLFR
jgi:peptidyl-prolyl cis-trans isomerase SurA